MSTNNPKQETRSSNHTQSPQVTLTAATQSDLTAHFGDAAPVIQTGVTTAIGAALLIRAQRAQYADVRSTIRTKSSDVDPVTAVDTAAEEYITTTLAALRPNDGVRGEEGAATPGTNDITWIIDPIDGTVNFVYGIPQYAVSLGVVRGGEIVAGVVINVAHGHLYAAVQGKGAWRSLVDLAVLAVTTNPKVELAPWTQLHVNTPASAAAALVATGFSYEADRRAAQAAMLQAVLPQVRDIRRQGSAALDLCAVASGEVDAYYEHGIHTWDYAAGMCIASEAGAQGGYPGVDTPGIKGELVWAAAGNIAAEFASLLQLGPVSIPSSSVRDKVVREHVVYPRE
ncbi:MAG: inositol monophosphatase family protein [Corynebacterium sp.]|nr:inositol monophosphatase family protein [Corynebacterium sp.]